MRKYKYYYLNKSITYAISGNRCQATRLSRSWIRKGYNKPILTTGSRTRVNLIGCIQLGHLSETLVNDYDKVNAEAIQDFLQRILNQYKDQKTT